MEDYKKKVFLVHRDQILKSIKEKMTQDKYQAHITKKRILSINGLISLWKTITCLSQNFAKVKAAKIARYWQFVYNVKIFCKMRLHQKQ